MISLPELERLLADIESDKAERTQSTNDTDKFCIAVTAFANDLPNSRQPGYLIVGVRNDGAPVGLTVTDQLLQNLAALRSDGNIQPLPTLSVAKFQLPGGQVAVVEVWPSDLPPVRYKGQIWIRVGPRRGIASEQEERRLIEKRISHAQTFDALPCLNSTLQDLALDLFRFNYLPQAVSPEVIEANHRTIQEQLASLRFFDSRHNCPTNAGILLFGKNPLEWMSGAFIQFVRFDGQTLGANVISERELSGDLLTVLRELDSLTQVQIQQTLATQSLLKEVSRFDYPPEALRELLMNGVLHRNYQSTAPVRFYWFTDRIEIQSPGPLYGEASPENFPNQNSYRNPILAEALKTLGFVNRFGRGVVRAQEALLKNGNKQAEFAFDDGFVRATLRRQN